MNATGSSDPSLKTKVLRSLGWSFTSQIGRQAAQLAITAALARLLSPGDFGLMSMAAVCIGFPTLLNEKGFSSALVQKEELRQAHYHSVFWINAAGAFVLTALFILLAPAIARFYGEKELERILVCLSPGFAIASLAIVPRAVMIRAMDFKKLALAESVSVVLGGAAGIALAAQGFGVWALVFQQLAASLALSGALWVLSSWKPEFSFSPAAVRELTRYGSRVSASFLLSYFQRNIDYLLIGKFLGAGPLGYYTLAYKLMLYPIQNISWVVSRVTFPVFSRIQRDLGKVRAGYLKVTKAVSMVNFPLLLGLLAVTPEFVRVVFGRPWEPAIGIIRIFCVCGLAQSIGTTVGDIFLSQGKAGLQLKLDLALAALMTAALAFGLRWGVYGVALMYTLVEFVWAPFAVSKSCRLIGLPGGEFARPLLKSLAAAAAMAAAVFAAKPLFPADNAAALAALVLGGGAVYAAILSIFERGFLWTLLPSRKA